MAQESGRAPDLAAVGRTLIAHFGRVFDYEKLDRAMPAREPVLAAH